VSAPLWKKFWLLFTVIWVIVTGLHIGTIVAFSEDAAEQRKAPILLVLAVSVPVVVYLLAWAWASWRRRHSNSGSEH
jgi:ABC-type dipeptide/oligopeptide/nickel transport system permease component